MWRKFLLMMMALSFLFELIFTLAGLFAPEWTLAQYGLPADSNTLFLAFVLTWMLLLITLMCGLVLKELRAGEKSAYSWSLLLGLWWVAVGIAVYAYAGRIEPLFLDSGKGALIVLATLKARRHSSV